MELIDRVDTLVELGKRLGKVEYDKFQKLVQKASVKNPWFTNENIELSFEGLQKYLDESKIKTWIDRYDIPKRRQCVVGIVMAGNIPMVGIHDLLCTIISGHKAFIKLSSQDEVIIPYLVQELIKIEPKIENLINFVKKLEDFDAVIGTGSDNTARYFDSYFGKYPNIIRKNRTSVAILNDHESAADLKNLGHDIFSYFGLGCRNVSKLFVPGHYEIENLIPSFHHFTKLINHNKYCNNYHYNKSILLVNNSNFIDGEFVLFQKSKNLVSPISMVYYDYYEDEGQLQDYMENIDKKIQCIVTNKREIKVGVPFGSAQRPELWDYADRIDTMKFLTSL